MSDGGVSIPFLTNRRRGNYLGAAVCASLMGYALFVQHGLGLVPCPLCILQRIAVIVTGLIFLGAAVHNPGSTGVRVYALLVLAATGLGAVVAGRHIWLQALPPDEVPACGPGLDYMLEFFPLTEALQMVFEGSGECAKIDWMFLGLSMPAWVFMALLGLATYAVLVNWLLPRESGKREAGSGK